MQRIIIYDGEEIRFIWCTGETITNKIFNNDI